LKDSLEEDKFKGARQLDRPNEARPPEPGNPPEPENATEEQLRRWVSRDQILFQKRNSLPKKHEEIMKDAPLTEAPKIHEEHIETPTIIENIK